MHSEISAQHLTDAQLRDRERLLHAVRTLQNVVNYAPASRKRWGVPRLAAAQRALEAFDKQHPAPREESANPAVERHERTRIRS